jgi:hypothetical protein
MSLAAHSLNWYRFIGRILGKALYEGILVDVAFAGFFLAKVFLHCSCYDKTLLIFSISVARKAEFLGRFSIS